MTRSWMLSQPGIVKAFVNRERIGERWRIEVILVQVRNGWGPPLPALDESAAILGYRGASGPFRPS